MGGGVLKEFWKDFCQNHSWDLVSFESAVKIGSASIDIILVFVWWANKISTADICSVEHVHKDIAYDKDRVLILYDTCVLSQVNTVDTWVWTFLVRPLGTYQKSTFWSMRSGKIFHDFSSLIPIYPYGFMICYVCVFIINATHKLCVYVCFEVKKSTTTLDKDVA